MMAEILIIEILPSFWSSLYSGFMGRAKIAVLQRQLISGETCIIITCRFFFMCNSSTGDKGF